MGPLEGTRVLEFAGIGPGPFAAMLLSDFGADVLRIDRPGTKASEAEVVARGRSSLALDLKNPSDIATCLNLIDKADVLIEGFRPGVMERLGLGPEIALRRNPRLIYGRMTGWGQTGPLAQAAAHDINYIALTGALASIGPQEGPPTPPLNLVGDFGGGSLYLALGICAALCERAQSGSGQVVDAAIVDGTASLMSTFSWLQAAGTMSVRRGDNNFLDGSAHYYRCYQCADGAYIAVGAIEPHFYALLLDRLDVPADQRPGQHKSDWARGSELFASIFAKRARAEWCALLEGTDACFAPVLEFDEASQHDHMKARNVFVEAFGVAQPNVAPRFSRTPGQIQGPPPAIDANGHACAERWGVTIGPA